MNLQSKSEENEVVIDSILVCLEIYVKCLQFDYIAIYQIGSLEDPGMIDIPKSWLKYVARADTFNILFKGIKVCMERMMARTKFYRKYKNIANLMLKVAGEYANIKTSVFE